MRHAGEEHEPWYVECATTVPFGFFYIRDRGSIFAVQGSFTCNPDVGVRRALETLGFSYEYDFFEEPDKATRTLQERLSFGPVVAGPVTTRLLAYDPAKRFVPPNSDHYVLVLSMDDKSVTLHDPEGFLYTKMGLEAFLKSWKAEKIPYKQGSYTMISHVRKKKSVDSATLYQRILGFARGNLRESPPEIGVDYLGVGSDAMRQLASDFSSLKPTRAWRSLFYFSFPLSTQRCHDVAMFLANASHRREMTKAVETKLKQSMHYSELRGLVRERRWKEMSATLSKIADLEDEFIKVLETA